MPYFGAGTVVTQHQPAFLLRPNFESAADFANFEYSGCGRREHFGDFDHGGGQFCHHQRRSLHDLPRPRRPGHGDGESGGKGRRLLPKHHIREYVRGLGQGCLDTAPRAEPDHDPGPRRNSVPASGRIHAGQRERVFPGQRFRKLHDQLERGATSRRRLADAEYHRRNFHFSQPRHSKFFDQCNRRRTRAAGILRWNSGHIKRCGRFAAGCRRWPT